MMTQTAKSRLIVFVAILLVGTVVLLFAFLGGRKDAGKTANESPAIGADQVSRPETVDTPAAPQGLQPVIEIESRNAAGKTASLQVAELFSERYASYSNQGRYQNLRDLLPIMTSEYRAETEMFLRSVSNTLPSESYEGYTAVKVATKEIEYDAERGTVRYEVTLQQVKTAGTSAPETLYPVLRVGLKKAGENWRVASAEWVR